MTALLLPVESGETHLVEIEDVVCHRELEQEMTGMCICVDCWLWYPTNIDQSELPPQIHEPWIHHQAPAIKGTVIRLGILAPIFS